MSVKDWDFNISKARKIALQSYKKRFISTFKVVLRDRAARVGLLILAGFACIAVFAPYIAPFGPTELTTTPIGLPTELGPPNERHPMGTTAIGHDVFSQWVYGARVSFFVGLLSGFSVLVIGTTVGLLAGYYKGTVDLVLMRVVDVLYGIPATPFILVLAMFLGASVWNVIIGMTLILWRTMARVIRAQTLSVSERPFVKAARASGASDLRIMYMHIAPNLVPLMLIETTLVIAWAIMLEAGLSFLGLGATNVVSWGTMLQMTFNTGAIRHAWWWVLPPGLGITLMVMAFFYISRAIEEVTNPELGGRR